MSFYNVRPITCFILVSSCSVVGIACEPRYMREGSAPQFVDARKDCEAGDLHQCVELGLIYRTGILIHRDDRRAAKLYEKACRGSIPRGCTNLGAMYEGGLGVKRDRRLAKSLYTAGCEGGSEEGCMRLSVMTEYHDVPYGQARPWLGF